MDQSGGMNMQPQSLIQEIIRHNLSGTGVGPDSTPVPMLMTHKSSWTFMFHANVFVLDEQQSSLRGAGINSFPRIGLWEWRNAKLRSRHSHAALHAQS